MKQGDTYKLNRKKFHYIGTIMDGDVELTVVKRWNKWSQSWVYETIETEIFDIIYEQYVK